MNNASDYSIVIPYYNDYNNLCLLLQDIAQTNQRFKPQKIIVVSDGATDNVSDIPERYNIDLLPEISLIEIPQSGVKKALVAGLNQVSTKYSIVLHSDVRLLTNNTNSYIHKDVLSVLYYHCSDVEDAMSVSCFSLSNLSNTKNKDYVSRGYRVIHISGTDSSILVHYSSHRVIGLIKDSLWTWFRVFSVSDNIFTLNMNLYHEVGGFDDTISDYGFFLDDFLAKSRVKGYHTYFTYDTVAFHKFDAEKPEGSMAHINESDWQDFCDKWAGDPAWTELSLFDEVAE